MQAIDAPPAAKRLNDELVGNELALATLLIRKRKLLDAYLDGLVDEQSYVDRLANFNADEISLNERASEIRRGIDRAKEGELKKFELLKNLKTIAHLGNQAKNAPITAQIREILKSAISNLLASEKSIAVQWIPAIEALILPDPPYMVHHDDT